MTKEEATKKFRDIVGADPKWAETELFDPATGKTALVAFQKEFPSRVLFVAYAEDERRWVWDSAKMNHLVDPKFLREIKQLQLLFV